MSDTMKLALQITAVDMLSGVVGRAKNSILNLGKAGRRVQKDFEIMERSVTRGLKAIAVSSYALNKMKPGVSAAADLQEAMLGVKMNLAGSAKSAKELTSMLSEVKGTAITVSADAPFSAEDVVKIQNALLKAGMDLKDVAGKSGAAFAATALASLSGEMPELVGTSLARIGSQFKLKGSEYSELSDWLVRVDDAAVTSLPELIAGLRMSGSAAAALGIPVADTVTAVGALANLGDRAGSSFGGFLSGIAGKTPAARKEMKQLNLSFFDKGKFVGMEEAIIRLKDKIGSINDDQEKSKILARLFGEEGSRAANEFLNAAKGFSEIEKSAKDSLSMAEKMSIWGEGLNAALAKIGGTSKSTLATLFDPLLSPLKEFLDLMNQAVGKVGELAEKHKGITAVGAYGMGAATLGLGGYGVFNLLKGGAAGARVLKGVGGMKGLLGGFGGTAAGIAKGKALEAATGVQPVFVTNWPATLGAAGALGDIAGGKAGKLGKLAGKLGKFGKLGVGAAGIGSTAIAGSAALAGGYAIGTGINKAFIEGTAFGDKIGEVLNRIVAAFGNEESRRAIVINNNLRVDENRRLITETDSMGVEVNNMLNLGSF